MQGFSLAVIRLLYTQLVAVGHAQCTIVALARGRPAASYQWYVSALFWLSTPTSLSAQRLLGPVHEDRWHLLKLCSQGFWCG